MTFTERKDYLDHIATLTAERDEARYRISSLEAERFRGVIAIANQEIDARKQALAEAEGIARNWSGMDGSVYVAMSIADAIAARAALEEK
jgi:hypothetical protein